MLTYNYANCALLLYESFFHISAIIQPDHTSLAKSEKHLNRPLIKPQKSKTSKLTTRQVPTSKSLCTGQNQPFGHIPVKQ